MPLDFLEVVSPPILMCDTVHPKSLLSQTSGHFQKCSWYWNTRVLFQSQWLLIRTNNFVPEGKQLCGSLFITKQDSSIGASTKETLQMELPSHSGLFVKRNIAGETNGSNTAIYRKQVIFLRSATWQVMKLFNKPTCIFRHLTLLLLSSLAHPRFVLTFPIPRHPHHKFKTQYHGIL